jgi:hypothetical protein
MKSSHYTVITASLLLLICEKVCSQEALQRARSARIYIDPLVVNAEVWLLNIVLETKISREIRAIT